MAKPFYGSISKLVSILFAQNSQAITLTPDSGTTYTAARIIKLPPGDAASQIVGDTSSQTLTNKTLTSPTITGGTHTAITGLGIRDTSAAFDVTLAAVSSSALSAGRTLTLDMVNAARSVKLQGNIDLAGNLTTAGALITSGANSLTLTTSGATNVTLPTTGTLSAVGGIETFSAVKTFSAQPVFSAGFKTSTFLANAGALTITSGAGAVKIPFSAEVIDSNSNYDPVTNYRFTPTVAGTYLINAHIRIDTTTTLTAAHLRLFKNGSEIYTDEFAGITSTSLIILQASVAIAANGSTDYFEAYVDATGTGTLSLQTSATRTWFCGSLIG